jgi:hypothetical protein
MNNFHGREIETSEGYNQGSADFKKIEALEQLLDTFASDEVAEEQR